MKTQTVFKAGNSNVVAVPKYLLRELKIKSGQEVIVAKLPDAEAIVIKKAVGQTKTKKAARKEFDKWLNIFMKENGEILDELAVS